MNCLRLHFSSFYYLLLLVLPLSGCAQKNIPVLSENHNEMEVTLGQLFTIELPTHPGTGFSWELKEPVDSTIIHFLKKEYKAIGDEQLDFPGLDYFEFESIKKGKTQVIFWYIRPWKKDNDTNPDIKTETFKISIN